MISVQTHTRTWNAEHWVAFIQDPRRATWWTTFGIFHVLSSVVLVRRLLGSFEQPLLARQIILVSLLATLLCVILRNSWHVVGLGSFDRTSTIAFFGSLTFQVFLLLLAISLSGTSVIGLVTSWALFVGVEASWWTRFLDRRIPSTSIEPVVRQASSNQLISDLAANSESEELAEEAWPADVTQQLTRLRRENGGETIVGGVRVDFAPRERHRVIHLSICPPLHGPPHFQVEQSEGPEVNVDVAQCEPFGVRLEVKLLQESDQPASAVLQFEMT